MRAYYVLSGLSCFMALFGIGCNAWANPLPNPTLNPVTYTGNMSTSYYDGTASVSYFISTANPATPSLGPSGSSGGSSVTSASASYSSTLGPPTATASASITEPASGPAAGADVNFTVTYQFAVVGTGTDLSVPVDISATGTLTGPGQAQLNIPGVLETTSGNWTENASFNAVPYALYSVELKVVAAPSASLTSAMATVDPTITIDSSFADASLFSIIFSPGVANGPLNGAPGPIAGAGLPGLLFASGGLLAWWRRKQRAEHRITPSGALRPAT